MRITAESGTRPTALFTAGACTLAVEALEDLLDGAAWFTAERSQTGFEIEIRGLRYSDHLDAARSAVDALFEATPELSGWSWAISESSADEPDEADYDEGGLALQGLGSGPADLVTEFEDLLRTEATLVALAPHFRALDLGQILGQERDESPEPAPHPDHARLAGLLVMSALVVADELHHDAACLRIHSIDEAPVLIVWMLPERFKYRYSPVFVQRLTTVFADLTRQVQVGWESPSCVAQELCVRIWLDQTEILAETHKIDLPDGWRVSLEDVLFEDLDHEYLFDPAYDGFEDDPDFGPGGMASMRFDDWFRPFRSTQLVPLYALPTADDPDATPDKAPR